MPTVKASMLVATAPMMTFLRPFRSQDSSSFSQNHRPADIKQQQESYETGDFMNMSDEYVAEQPAHGHEGGLHDTEGKGYREDFPP